MRLAAVLFALFSAVVVSMGVAHRVDAGPLTGPTPICPARTCAVAK